MKRFFFSFILIIVFLSFSAQSHDVQSLLRYPNSKEDAIYFGRQFMHEHFCVNDTSNVSKVFQYLSTLDDKDSLAFYPEEIQLYNYWTGNYTAIFDFIDKYDTAYINSLYRRKYYPSEKDMIDLIDFARKERVIISDQIESDSSLKRIDKDFLKLNFDQQLTWGKNKDIAVDSLNARGRKFLDKYPQYKYNQYVEDHIGIELINRKWVYSVEFFAGAIFHKGKLNDMKNPAFNFGGSLNFRYRRIALNIINCFGFTVLRDTVRSKNVTLQNETTTLFVMPGIALGYYVFNKQKLKVYPFAGVAAAGVLPFKGMEENPSGDSYGFMCGISIDFFLRESRTNDFNWVHKDHHYIRLTYIFYQLEDKNRYPVLNNTVHNLTLGFVMQSNPNKRVK